MLKFKSDKSDWFWSQSTCIVFTKPFKTGMSLDLARGPDFQRMTEGTPGDEVVNKCSGFLLLAGFVFLVQLES